MLETAAAAAFTASLLSSVTPDMCCTWGPAADTTLWDLWQYPLYCTVAPSSESTRDPPSPAHRPIANQNTPWLQPSVPHMADLLVMLLIRRLRCCSSPVALPVNQSMAPMHNPPAALAISPCGLTAPFTPGGTRLRVVMSRGGRLLNIPSSLAQVSAQQQA
eukprot:GHUV01036434.1.p2 GENE.GHUV01036434.1~~GHUV01036434.1.p2  ORF type:complete len:161 (-),score=59.86 GHUV01036434.1:1221-1703(-)